MGEEEELSLKFTPTWVVATVCAVIIAISFLVERCLYYGGKYLKMKNQKPLFEALQKVKEELMLLGFISMMLTVLQGTISKICIPEKLVKSMLPCSLSEKSKVESSTADHNGMLRRLLVESEVSQLSYFARKTHCKGNLKFNFHKYMIWALEDDFKQVVGISWYLWIIVIIFLLLNVNGWHTYFWIAFIPFILLLAVGTKLEHVIAELAHEVAEKHVAIQGDLVVTPSDEHFWFNRPKLILFFIHFILFQNAFEIAYFFWIWVHCGFDSCIMGKVRYIVPRLIIGAIIQILCSYSTLPLYAIVTQVGEHC